MDGAIDRPRAATAWAAGHPLPPGYGHPQNWPARARRKVQRPAPQKLPNGRYPAGAVRDCFVQALREGGPATAKELAQQCGIPTDQGISTISSALRAHGARYFQVVGEEPPIGRSGPAARIYAAGTG